MLSHIVFLISLKLVWATSSISAQIYTQLTQSHPCVRLLNSTGHSGCSTPRNGWEGALRNARNDKELQALFDSPPDYKISVIVTRTVFTKENLLKIADTLDVAGVLLLAEGPDPKAFSPGAVGPDDPSSTTAYKWNPHGTGLNYANFPFGIVILSSSESDFVKQRADLNEKLVKDNNFAYYYAQFKYAMSAEKDSLNCLKENTCMPLGGYSTWGSYGTAGINTTKEVVMAVTSFDSTALFHQIAVGAEEAVSGTVTLLAALDAIAMIGGAEELEKQIAWGFFAGESYGNIGSRRFVSEIQSFKCEKELTTEPGCADPYAPDWAFTNLKLNKISTVLDVSSLGLIENNTVYLHHTNNKEAKGEADLIKVLKSSATAAGLVARESVTKELPPSSANSFVEANNTINTVVLTDYDTEFKNKYYQSIYDDFDNKNGIFNLDVKGLPDPPLCLAAKMAAVALYTQASGSSVDEKKISEIKVNCTLIKELFTCLTKDLTCSLVKSFVPGWDAAVGSKKGDKVPHYTSVYYPLLMTSKMYARYKTTEFLYNALSSISTNGTAGSATQHYHVALDPDLHYNIVTGLFDVKKGSKSPLWTESNWNTVYTRIYRKEETVMVYATLGAGVFVLFASIIMLRWMRGSCQKRFKTL